MKIYIYMVVLLYYICIYTNAGGVQEGVPVDYRAGFEIHYEAWKRYCEEVQMSSSVSSRLQSPDFQAIVSMGPEALPLVAEKCIQDTNFHWIAWAWTTITRMQNDPAVNPWAKDSIRTWWEGGAELAKQRSLLLCEEMNTARKEGRSNDADVARRSIRALGIFSLETLFAELEKGNVDALPIIHEILSRDLQETGSVRVRDWWIKNKKRYALPSSKTSPDTMTNSMSATER